MLQVADLVVEFDAGGGREAPVRAVDGISFHVDRGETLGLVGESGCGKSAAALSIVGLVPPPGRVAGGSILFEARDLLDCGERELQKVRGARIGFVFQEPMAALNPSFTIGDQIAEALAQHGVARGAQARQRVVDLLAAVRIPAPERCARSYAHHLSGGMRQRAVIAAAIACQPSLLVADEPTTALDMTTQAEVLDLLGDMRQDLGLALLLITHDLGIVAGLADRVAVMYAGQIVEVGPTRDVLRSPAHPYTRGLLASLPGARPGTRLEAIPGVVPSPGSRPPGCTFASRCTERIDGCDVARPGLRSAGAGHLGRCLLLREEP
ncbi:MAG: ABC transporter ATP-binding protein [Acidobacteriota bacterium]